LEFLNASLLWTLGKHLEPHLVLPFLSVPFIYWLPGVVGSLASANLDAKYIVTGASNAICGLLGAPLLQAQPTAGHPASYGRWRTGNRRDRMTLHNCFRHQGTMTLQCSSFKATSASTCHSSETRTCTQNSSCVRSATWVSLCHYRMATHHASRRSCAAGGVVADQVFNWRRFAHRFWTAVVLAVVLAIYVLLGFLPYVDNFGHLFGLATGFFLTTCLLRSFQVHGLWLLTLYCMQAMLDWPAEGSHCSLWMVSSCLRRPAVSLS